MPYTVAVRALCEFTAKAGDLDLRFSPSPTAREGLAGHAAVQAARGPGYEAEVALEGRFEDLRVRGRADGWDPARRRLEEIKTHRGDLARQPANHRALHWAQARVYGWLLCEAHGLERLTLALVYLDVASGRETVLEEERTREELQAVFADHCGRFLAWARREQAHRAARDAALSALAFPHAQWRAGQRALAEAAYKAAVQRRCLLAQAPTGIGKTLGTLFPLLKAAPAQGLDKLLFLAAKTPGRQLALDALHQLRAAAPGLPLRVLELSAREKACEHPDKACHGDSCPLARGFHDRLPAARAAALDDGRPLDTATLREVAAAHAVCPYWLAQELVRWADVVVGDYNYQFDGNGLLHLLAQEQDWKVALLVDEAHNLPERARAMYSAALDLQALREARRGAPQPVQRALDRLRRVWSQLPAEPARPVQLLQELPGDWIAALQRAGATLGEHLEQVLAEPPGPLLQFHFDLQAFLRLAETWGEHSVLEVSVRPGPRGPEALPCIRNLVPAPFLGPRWAAVHAAVLFSATLAPAGYYRDVLGLPADTVWVDVESPFEAAQLQVRLVRSISTRWADRERSLQPVADLLAREWRARPGNWLAFFSSFDYLRRVAAALRERHPELPLLEQVPSMPEAQRHAFLAHFQPGGQCLGLAVLGGPFGEGIDLPGDRLVGAFVATLGLPQVNPLNEELRRRLDRAFGAGWDYAYLYPGLRKVVQAAGRVIRTREDRGTVVLVDDRWGRPEVRALLPGWWQVDAEPRPPGRPDAPAG
jgi:Rad3-related DNA helicase